MIWFWFDSMIFSIQQARSPLLLEGGEVYPITIFFYENETNLLLLESSHYDILSLANKKYPPGRGYFFEEAYRQFLYEETNFMKIISDF